MIALQWFAYSEIKKEIWRERKHLFRVGDFQEEQLDFISGGVYPGILHPTSNVRVVLLLIKEIRAS